MADKYISLNVSGDQQEVEGLVTSSGAPDAGAIPALDSTGRLDDSLMPVGIVPEVKDVVTSENLSAGDLVNLFNNAGTLTARKADASNAYRANGFVLASSTSPATARVYFEGSITGLSGLTPGATYILDDTAGGIVTTSAGFSAGDIVQQVGFALSATELLFEAGAVTILA
jgi:hypothetical protein